MTCHRLMMFGMLTMEVEWTIFILFWIMDYMHILTKWVLSAVCSVELLGNPSKILTDQMAGWLCDWLTDWWTDSLADWLADSLTHWLTGWLTSWLTDWWTGSLGNSLANLLACWLTDWQTGRLADCPTNCKPTKKVCHKLKSLLYFTLALSLFSSGSPRMNGWYVYEHEYTCWIISGQEIQWPDGQCTGLWVEWCVFRTWSGQRVVLLNKTLFSHSSFFFSHSTSLHPGPTCLKEG